jgi:DinB superfamily
MTTQPVSHTTAQLLRRIVLDARHILDGTMADVTQTQSDFIPPGTANPLGATYAHVVCSEDLIVQRLFRQVAPLAETTWAGRTGLSEPMPRPSTDWADYGPWTRRVKIDLQQLQAYGRAVAEETDRWLAGLSDAELEQPMDLSRLGFGQHTWASAIALLVANHLGTQTGEISVLKGIQGARGYPR